MAHLADDGTGPESHRRALPRTPGTDRGPCSSGTQRSSADWDLGLRELIRHPFCKRAKPGARLGQFSSWCPRSHHSRPARTVVFVPAPAAAPPQLAADLRPPRNSKFVRKVGESALAAAHPSQPATHLEAWLRIARLERKLNRPAAALDAYERSRVKPRPQALGERPTGCWPPAHGASCWSAPEARAGRQ